MLLKFQSPGEQNNNYHVDSASYVNERNRCCHITWINTCTQMAITVWCAHAFYCFFSFVSCKGLLRRGFPARIPCQFETHWGRLSESPKWFHTMEHDAIAMTFSLRQPLTVNREHVFWKSQSNPTNHFWGHHDEHQHFSKPLNICKCLRKVAISHPIEMPL